ncbi:unnamed protein product [Arabidopsis halleri]
MSVTTVEGQEKRGWPKILQNKVLIYTICDVDGTLVRFGMQMQS